MKLLEIETSGIKGVCNIPRLSDVHLMQIASHFPYIKTDCITNITIHVFLKVGNTTQRSNVLIRTNGIATISKLSKKEHIIDVWNFVTHEIKTSLNFPMYFDCQDIKFIEFGVLDVLCARFTRNDIEKMDSLFCNDEFLKYFTFDSINDDESTYKVKTLLFEYVTDTEFISFRINLHNKLKKRICKLRITKCDNIKRTLVVINQLFSRINEKINLTT